MPQFNQMKCAQIMNLSFVKESITHVCRDWNNFYEELYSFPLIAYGLCAYVNERTCMHFYTLMNTHILEGDII